MSAVVDGSEGTGKTPTGRGKNKSVGTAKSEGAKKAKSKTGEAAKVIESVKTPVADTKPTGPYLGNQALDDEIAEYLRRRATRCKGAFDSAYADAEDLDRLVKKLDDGEFKGIKRRNGTDPYDIIAEYPDSDVGAKQLRRQHSFYKTVVRIRKAALTPPLLGVTHYAEVQKLKSVESIVKTLDQVVEQDLSVRQLIAIVDQMPDGAKKEPRTQKSAKNKCFSWLKELKTVVGTTTKRLAQIDEAMGKSKATLSPEDSKELKKLSDLINSILKRAK